MINSPGKVYLVGAGPGDPGLITLKGMRCLEQAEVVIYDRLMDPSLIDSAPSSAERIFVGKERGRRELTQDQIKKLESLKGWSWDPIADNWEDGFTYLLQFVEREGHARVVKNFITGDEYNLFWIYSH